MRTGMAIPRARARRTVVPNEVIGRGLVGLD